MLPPLAIQLLASDGGPSEALTFVDEEATSASIKGRAVPTEVLAAAKRLAEGEGLYLDADGLPVEPF